MGAGNRPSKRKRGVIEWPRGLDSGDRMLRRRGRDLGAPRCRGRLLRRGGRDLGWVGEAPRCRGRLLRRRCETLGVGGPKTRGMSRSVAKKEVDRPWGGDCRKKRHHERHHARLYVRALLPGHVDPFDSFSPTCFFSYGILVRLRKSGKRAQTYTFGKTQHFCKSAQNLSSTFVKVGAKPK